MSYDTFPVKCATRFKPVRLLGEGGFGAVWLATQIGLDRPVAIKFIRTDVTSDKEALDRFKNEARVTALLSHPSIVRVIDHDVEEGVPWIAYEYLPGRPLSEILAAGPMRWSDALKVGHQVAGALEEAHSKGIIHRDIKPENVLEVEPGRFKLADFGIAKWTAGTEIRTRTGFIMGTPTHVPPEQIKGEPASPQGDVYALGVLMYQMLTGQLPFRDPSILGLLRAHLDDKATTPSRLQLDLPPEVDTLIKRALEKSPGKRFADGAELRRAIEAVARPASSDETARPAPESPSAGVAAATGDSAGRNGGGPSGTRMPRPNSRTRAVTSPERPAAKPASPAVPRTHRYAAAAALFLAGLAGFVILAGRSRQPEVIRTLHSGSAVAISPAPAVGSASASALASADAPTRDVRSSSAEASASPGATNLGDLFAVMNRIGAEIRDVDAAQGVTKGKSPDKPSSIKPSEVGAVLSRCLRAITELIKALDLADRTGPGWSEEIALGADQLLQRVQRVPESQRRGELNSLLELLNSRMGTSSSDPHRRAAMQTIRARITLIKSRQGKAGLTGFQSALDILGQEATPAWSRSLGGLKTRLQIAYQLGSAAARQNDIGQLTGHLLGSAAPAEVERPWAQMLEMGAQLEVTTKDLAEVNGKTAAELWECNKHLMRVCSRIFETNGYSTALRSDAERTLVQLVERCRRIRFPAEYTSEVAYRLEELAKNLRDADVRVKLPGGLLWPPPATH